MKYLFLTSTDMPGFIKTRIDSVPAHLVGHWRGGKAYKPDLAQVRAHLPRKYRAAFDRCPGVYFDNNLKDYPAYMTLRNWRGKYLNTLYFQPLRESV